MSFFAASSELSAWVRDLPDGWRKNWLKWSVRLHTDRATEDEAAELPYISNEDITSWTGKLLKRDPQPTEADGRKFQSDDVLFNKLRPYLAKVYHAEFPGISSGELLCLRPSGSVFPRYLFYVVASNGFIASVNAETFGSKMPRADWEIAGHQDLPLPPLKTQRRIAQFLDEKTGQVDALVEKKLALLERLVEKRQALITRAVTKGLDPGVPMRDSGIDWLGEIPAHWKIFPLKRKVESSTYGVSASLEPDGKVAILRMGNLNDGELDFSNLKFLDNLDRGLLLHPRDVIFNRTNSLDLVGKTAIYRGNFGGDLSLASYLVRFRFLRGYSAEYANYVMRTDILMNFARTLALPSIGQANLNPSRYAAISFPIPPIGEQDAIVRFLNTNVELLKKTGGEIEKSVIQLNEFRSALISAAITGKIRGLQ